MSDPVTNVEIEDVLSSIRRLVSEDTRFDSRKKPEDAGQKPAKLVLTPAQRVPETEAVDVETEVLSSAERDDAPWRDPNATLFEAADGATPTEDNAEASEDVYTLKDMIDPVEDISDSVEDGVNEDPALEDDEYGADVYGEGLDETFETEEIEYVDVDPEHGDIIDHDEIVEYDDEDEDAFEEEHPDSDLHDEDYHDAEYVDEYEDEYEDDLIEDTPEGVADPSPDERVAVIGDKIKALEAAIARSSSQWEPDGSDDTAEEYDDSPRQTSTRWTAQTRTQTPPPVEPAKPSLAADEAILDEEMLRELVSDIVREELQGALGERITRNVRKLVRREIQRAMTVQEFE